MKLFFFSFAFGDRPDQGRLANELGGSPAGTSLYLQEQHGASLLSGQQESQIPARRPDRSVAR